jgi:hypothetical protein
MKLFAASIVGLAVIASPVVAQPDNTAATENTHVKTTTKEVHATNVPVQKHHAKAHHHAMSCSCPSSHVKAHHATHHVVKQTTTTTKTPG